MRHVSSALGIAALFGLAACVEGRSSTDTAEAAFTNDDLLGDYLSDGPGGTGETADESSITWLSLRREGGSDRAIACAVGHLVLQGAFDVVTENGSRKLVLSSTPPPDAGTATTLRFLTFTIEGGRLRAPAGLGGIMGPSRLVRVPQGSLPACGSILPPP
jgi:hypothetical protein